MKLKRKYYILLGVVLTALAVWIIFFRFPLTYSAKPIAGQVVDADTGQPLEGAIVIAIWELYTGFNYENDILAGQLHVAEVLTDKAGYYHIEGWGPEWRPSKKYLSHNAPLLVVFKEGYDFFARGNSYESIFKDTRYKWIQESSWNRETIKLKKFEGNLEEYGDRLWRLSSNFNSLLKFYFGAERCAWKKIPHMILVFDKYDEKLQKEKISSVLVPDLEHLTGDGSCGTKADFLRSM